MKDIRFGVSDNASIRFLRRTEAARFIQKTYGFPCSREWLAKLAVTGGGPVYRKAGRTPIYMSTDLDAWAADRIGAPQRSTSDVSPTRKAKGIRVGSRADRQRRAADKAEAETISSSP